MTRTNDRWHRWLLGGRHGDDAACRDQMLAELLYPVRDTVLDRARLRPGETLLDVGAGDGLIAFEAIKRVGRAGRVIFSDVSQDLLDHCRNAVIAQDLLDQCSFVRASADALTGIADTSVDAVTTRSVLIYVTDKAAALQEFHRVLRPGGRISLFEPVSRPHTDPDRLYGCDTRPVAPLARKLVAFYELIQPSACNPMTNFNERDLVRHAEGAGFPEIELDLRIRVMAGMKPCPWQRFLKTASNPFLPTIEEIFEQALSRAEIAELTAYLRPLVESGEAQDRTEFAYLTAVKRLM